VLGVAPPAVAHPLVDEARRLVDQADFAAAEAAFARAEAATDLSRSDLVELLEGRALLHHALADTAALEADLARLAALEPTYQFGATIPPEIGDAFLRVRTRSSGPLRLEVEMRPVPGGLALRPATVNDPGGLVRTLEISARVARGPWRLGMNELVVTGGPGATVELFAVARGPGAVPIATRGSEAEPVAALLPGAPVVPAGGLVVEPRPASSSSKTWLWVTIGLVGVAGLVTGGVLLLTTHSDDTSVGGPEIRGF
jgi:hypothetical protein